MISEQLHYAGDEALSRLSQHQGAGGDLVRAFLGRQDEEDRKWLETWFQSRCEKHFAESLADSENSLGFDHIPVHVGATPLGHSVKLKSVQAHYFRGFRKGHDRIDMGEEFIVIEGRNSSGKTSLAEALEWLFSGSLSRWESSTSGNARELEQCITNVFRPTNEDTWVEATCASYSNGNEDGLIKLRRVLKEDYGTTAKEPCSSVLFLDDKKLSPSEERRILDKLFASVPPLLMQHTLRDFVKGDPNRRRIYFERLLRLDGVTELIRLAVISGDRTRDFLSPQGDKYLSLWSNLGSILENNLSQKAHSKCLRGNREITFEEISDALSSISRNEFPLLLDGINEHEEILAALKMEQGRVRQNSFPILAQLRPNKQLSDYPLESEPAVIVETIVQRLRIVWRQYETVSLVVQEIGEDNLAVARALKLLLDAGTIQHGRDSQTCPLCAFEQIDTLSDIRISEIEDWNPIRDSERAAQDELEKVANSLLDVVRKSLEKYSDFFPSPPSESDWDKSLQTAGDRLLEEVEKLREILEVHIDLSPHVASGKSLIATESRGLTSIEECESLIENCSRVIDGLAIVPNEAQKYQDALMAVETAVGDETISDPQYRLRERLIECFENASAIVDDLRWIQAKRHSQKDLQSVRTTLIAYRQQFLETRRMSFNNGIESVWRSLRDEKYSSFSQIHIPPPKGKGFPVAIELKALLDDNNEKKEVDALGVFSDSQVNALGIAAFVTRSKLLGHRLLIFDDPVQSMDEEHFKTFARDLITRILDDGFQVILLTHNDTFARDVSFHHHDRSDYVTMSIAHRRRSGSVVEEGNRKVPERLKTAKRKLENGDIDGAWTSIRLAIERLYIITYAKYGPSEFNPSIWQLQSAEYMWNEGAGHIIQSMLPKSGSRFKEILDMTAGGVHDKAALGETEIRKSLKFLRNALNELKLGG